MQPRVGRGVSQCTYTGTGGCAERKSREGTDSAWSSRTFAKEWTGPRIYEEQRVIYRLNPFSAAPTQAVLLGSVRRKRPLADVSTVQRKAELREEGIFTSAPRTPLPRRGETARFPVKGKQLRRRGSSAFCGFQPSACTRGAGISAEEKSTEFRRIRVARRRILS